MGKLLVIEGLDGAGKNTVTHALKAHLEGLGAGVHTVAFPRYGVDVHADLIRDGLHGRLGDVTESVYGFQLLFALDRRDAAGELREALERHDVVLVDRYVASNAAYGAARLQQSVDGEFVAGYLSGQVRGWSVADKLARANACGAVLCTVPGDWEAAPTPEDLEVFLGEGGDPVRR